MPRTYESPTELTHLDEDHIFPADYKSISGDDSKISMPNMVKHFPVENDVINGAFPLWQRFYTSKATLANGDYLADRFAYEKGGTSAVHTCLRETSVIPTGANQSLRLQCTTADASMDAGDYVAVTHIIEGFNVKKYVLNGYLCIGFWVRSPKTGVICFSIRNNGKDRSYIKEITITAADTWEYKTVNIPMNFSGGTWDYSTGAGIRLTWSLMAGSTYQSTKDAWQSGNYLATSNQVNLCDNTANNFYISLVTCNVGKLPLLSNYLNIELELTKAQRFYEKAYNVAVDPGTIVNTGAVIGEHNVAGTFLKLQKAFATKKRVNPTVIWYSNVTGTANRVYDNITPGDVTVSSNLYQGEHSTGIPIASSSLAAGKILSAFYTADAEISV